MYFSMEEYMLLKIIFLILQPAEQVIWNGPLTSFVARSILYETFLLVS